MYGEGGGGGDGDGGGGGDGKGEGDSNGVLMILIFMLAYAKKNKMFAHTPIDLRINTPVFVNQKHFLFLIRRDKLVQHAVLYSGICMTLAHAQHPINYHQHIPSPFHSHCIPPHSVTTVNARARTQRAEMNVGTHCLPLHAGKDICLWFVALTHSLAHSLTHSLTHLPNHSLTHSLTHSLNRSINQSTKQSITCLSANIDMNPLSAHTSICAFIYIY